MPKIDADGVEWFSEGDLSQFKGFANETTFNAFVERAGGSRLDTLHSNLDVPNADYIFPAERVIIE